ncbi:MAG: solute carrier, TRAMD3 or PAT1-domain-containing protein [Olpidium bornovanus]|uniref:Cilia- and flagella-associated protein 91 n=1 Tax=Olpidium bornovanus TaxID=278681 RepID=A0A8H8DLT9_9FUNG|nr:MAG: solute carrier, TRAMD3 or PAT1-domain-containing protein [Olpidium bornovanus]
MMHQPLPNRPQDYFYDGVYTVSSRKDHVKQMTAAQTHTMVIVPEYRNMFARALNYPSAHVEYRGHPLPRNFGQNRLELRRGDPQVTGMNRFKYFRKPFVPFLSPSGGQVVYAKRIAKKDAAAAREQQQQQPRAPSPLVKTVAVQTAYRESGTQTDPYSPDYVIPPGTQPEILALATLTWNAGLPAGVAELDMIERARAKRAWEATLPEVTDEASFEKRLRMMEEMELRELQEARLDILTKLIRKREVENEELNNERIEKIWQKKLQERDSLHEKIERKRIKGLQMFSLRNWYLALRMLDERRKNVDNIIERRDIIADYANYTSRVYAPKARDGIFRDQADGTLQLRDTGMMTFDGRNPVEYCLYYMLTRCADRSLFVYQVSNTLNRPYRRIFRNQITLSQPIRLSPLRQRGGSCTCRNGYASWTKSSRSARLKRRQISPHSSTRAGLRNPFSGPRLRGQDYRKTSGRLAPC